jgi:hypothetical protein
LCIKDGCENSLAIRDINAMEVTLLGRALRNPEIRLDSAAFSPGNRIHRIGERIGTDLSKWNPLSRSRNSRNIGFLPNKPLLLISDHIRSLKNGQNSGCR